MSRRVAVTGAAGWVGARLIAALQARGDEVVAVVRPGGRPAPFGLPGVPLGPDPAALAHALEGVDGVVHLAAHYVRDHRPADVGPLVHAQVEAGAVLLEALRLAGGPPLVAADSWFAWARAGADDAPVNLYGATRRAFGALLDWYAATAGQVATRLVIHDVYGPDDPRLRLVPALLRARATGAPAPLAAGDARVDLVWVDDVVNAFVVTFDGLRAAPGELAGRAFAVRTGEALRPAEVAHRLAAAGGRPVPTLPDALPAPSRAPIPPWAGPDLPGWRPTVSLDEGLRRLADLTPPA